MMGTRHMLANNRTLLVMVAVICVARLASAQVQPELVLSTAGREPLPSEYAVHEVPAGLRLAAEVPPATLAANPSTSQSLTPDQIRDRETVLGDWDAGDDSMFSTSALQSQIRKLAWGTVTVLALCVGFLVLGKRWLPGKVAAKETPQLQHLASLQLPNRCTVQLVEAEGCRVLVGTDASGVKMIVPLQAAFWEHVDEAQADHTHAAVAEETPGDVAAPAPTGFDLASVKASFQQLLSSRGSSV